MNKKTVIANIIFFGALWGLLEASLGHVLHFLPVLISGSIMFPIGAMLMYWAYRNTNSKKALIFIGLIAISIKTVNFFMPGLPPIKTYNPMISIMIQSLTLIGALAIVDKKSIHWHIFAILMVGIMWRSLFIANISINHALTNYPFPQLTSNTTTLTFIFINGVIESAIIGLVYLINRLLQKKISFAFKPNWLISISTYVVALGIALLPLF